jgi:dTDP-4-dehydrorhamnose 3,5-epimerase
MTVKLIRIYKNKIIKNAKGNIIKYVSTKNIFFEKFGEIYFNSINSNQKKGWNFHNKNQCLIMCILGEVKFHFIDINLDERKIILKSTTSKILKIPPRIWFSFKSARKKSIIANLIEKPHTEDEVQKKKKIKNYLIK